MHQEKKDKCAQEGFLATNISELLSNQIPVKYKDLGYPTLSCIIGQAKISR